jgi:hypothetical protein
MQDMSKTTYHVNTQNAEIVEALIDAFEARSSEHEQAIRTMLALHDRDFTLRLDFVSRPHLTPLDDAFTFDTLYDELVLYSNEAAVLVDALLEMAMYMRGFNTTLGSFDEWKTQFTIGSWRYVRRNIKAKLGFDTPAIWQFPLELDAVDRYNVQAFEAMIFFAGRPDGDVSFPTGANAQVVQAYERLRRIMQTMAFDLTLDDHETFNNRLAHVLPWVEQSIMPGEPSPFDDLFGPGGGLNDRYFGVGMDD